MGVIDSLSTTRQQQLKEVATAFSTGIFDQAYPYLDGQVIWSVVGENEFVGKDAVVTQCQSVRQYFDSVETIFEITDCMLSGHKIIVTGTAQFIREGKLLAHISSCDIYEFNVLNLVRKITSYCIRL